MTPKEILDQFYNGLNQRAKEVPIKAKVYGKQQASFGLVGVAPKRNLENDRTEIPDYTHCIVATKKYRDEGCAVYKLIRGAESLFPKKVEKLFWRRSPEVYKDWDFDKPYCIFKGGMRFSFS